MSRGMLVRRLVVWTFLSLLLWSLPAPAYAQCAGDCDGNEQVGVNELIRCVNVALGTQDLQQCSPCDTNRDGVVVIGELITGVNNALKQGGCGAGSDCRGAGNCATGFCVQGVCCTVMACGEGEFCSPGTGECSSGTPPTRTKTRTPSPTSSPTRRSTDTPTRTPTATATRSATRTVSPTPTPTNMRGGTYGGVCRAPGPLGLAPCPAGTMVRLSRCDNRFTCLGLGGLTLLDQGVTDAAGNFSLSASAAQTQGARLVVEADFGSARIYRRLTFGALGEGQRQGVSVGEDISPVSEASARILAERGFENFADDGVVEVAAAVELANLATDFAGLGISQAVQTAKQAADGDAQVVDAIMQNKSGPICEDTIWRAEASPFVVVQSIILGNSLVCNGETDVTLEIEPGVEVQFENGRVFVVGDSESGEPGPTLIARGTSDSPIVFRSRAQSFPEVGKWNGVQLLGTTRDAVFAPGGVYESGSVLEWVTVEDVVPPDLFFGVMRIESSNPYLANLTVEDNERGAAIALQSVSFVKLEGGAISGNGWSGIDIRDSAAEIRQARISGSSPGVNIPGGGNLLIEGGLIENNDRGIICGATCTIVRSTIRGNDRSGVSPGAFSFGNIDIVGSSIVDNRGVGVDFAACRGEMRVSDSLIARNSQGGLISTYCDSGFYDIRDSCFLNNGSFGATLNGLTVGRGMGTFVDNTVINNPIVLSGIDEVTVTENNLVSTQGFALIADMNLAGGTFDATGNWWGTTISAVIAGVIRDKLDDGTLRLVDFDPFAAEPIAGAPDIDLCREGIL